MRQTSAELENQLEKVRDLESRLTFRLSVLSKILDRQSSELLKGTSLSLTAYRILSVVDTFGEISISDISRFNVLDRGQVSRTADTLGKQGLVEFADNPHSKRKKLLRLSKSGYEKLREVRPKFTERQRELVESLGPEAHEGLGKGLDRLDEILSA